MKPIPHFDIRQHLREWHRYVLPLAILVSAVMLIVLLALYASRRSRFADFEDFVPSRIGLLQPGEDAVFDPAFIVASPIEMASAPRVSEFDYPVGSPHGALTYNAQPFLTDRHLGDDLNGIGGWNSDLGDPVYAVADGLAVLAGWSGEGWGNVVILLHEFADGRMMETFYGHLDSIRVPVGAQVRRGDKVGTIGNADGRYLAHLHFEIRRYPSLDVGGGYADSKLGRLSGELSLKKWRSREDDVLAGPPKGEPLPPLPLTLEVEGETRPSP